MLSVLTCSFDKTEKLAPSSQQVCLTFLLKKFFELSEIDSAESKNKKSAFFLSKNRSMNYPDGCIANEDLVEHASRHYVANLATCRNFGYTTSTT